MYSGRRKQSHPFVYFIHPTTCNLYNVLDYYQRSTCFGWFFGPSSGAYKTICAALCIVMLSCCLPLVWNTSNPSKPLLYECFVTRYVFTVRRYWHLAQNPSWRTTPFWKSATVYSIYSQLPSILKTVHSSAT